MDGEKGAEEMVLFDRWCHVRKQPDRRRHLWTLTEKDGAREDIRDDLVQVIRSHYDRLERIADDVERLGYAKAATILKSVLPQSKRARSGEIGEILATELVEEQVGFNVPVRRLRYKDGREMALRGDDFIGVAFDDNDHLRLLKGESKSRRVLNRATITQARTSLDRDQGRCTPESLWFVASHLLDSADEQNQDLGRVIRDEVGLKALRSHRIDHMLFTLSGNGVPQALMDDWQAASATRTHYVVNLHVADHGDFVRAVYEEVQDLGND